MIKTVIISIVVEGFHNYPNAPKKVNYLSFNHRHNFKINCGFLVNDLNREIEIFIYRNKIKKYLYEKFGEELQFNNMSCEMIAYDIINNYKEKNMIWCEVWEEETGGARVEI